MSLNEILASADDINTHLPTDKLDVTDDAATAAVNLFEIDVDRLIKGTLSGVFAPTTLASWISPATTPQWIRGAAGRLIAGFYYAQRYSEDLASESSYAQGLYNEGMCMLEQVRNGDVILPISEAPAAETIF